MNRCFVYSLIVLLLLSATGACADQLLDPNETESLLRQLTETPRRQWLTNGMIQARHLEYYSVANEVKESTQTVYSDGSQMRLEICLTNEQATGKPTKQMDQDFKLNQNRIFVQSTQQSVQYYKSADYAVVTTGLENTPSSSRGPLTAGIIPWGHGDFTFLVLQSQSPKVYKRLTEGQLQYVFTYTNTAITPDIDVTLVLDPSKANAVLSYTIENDLALLRQNYQNYLLEGGQWVPSKVLIERFDKSRGDPKLLSYEDWEFDAIDASMPADDVFSVQFHQGTTVELHPGPSLETFLYDASDEVNISDILADKIGLLSAEQNAVNCATAAINYIAKQYSRQLHQETLAGMIAQNTQKTNLYDMKNTLENAGLNCMAISTDLETLGKIENCKAILHLELSNHYVILEDIDPDGAWIIDLTNRQFFTKRKIDDLMMEWNSGTALLVSDEPITPPLDANFNYLPQEDMRQILGGDFGTYSCTNKLQSYEHVLCSEPFGGFLCNGAYYVFLTRYGCIEDQDGGTCVGKKFPSYRYSQCLNDPEVQGSCMITGDWTSRYMRACE